MLTSEYALVLSAWLRLPREQTLPVMASLRRGGLLPGPRTALSHLHAAAGLIGVMAAALGGAAGAGARAEEAFGMSLEAAPGSDPLDAMPREPFCRMVGETAGMLSMNGYLTLGQTVGTALRRHEENLGAVELEALSLRFHGDRAVGVVEARTPAGPASWSFTRDGSVAPRSGLYREVSVGAAALAGIAFVLSADLARG